MKEVFSMSQNMPICSLQLEPLDPPASGYQVLASTANPSRLFLFSGAPSFATLFAAYSSLESQTCVELPGDATATDLQLFRRRNAPRAESFSLLTGLATYFGPLPCPPHPLTAGMREVKHAAQPLAAVPSQYHLLLLYPLGVALTQIPPWSPDPLRTLFRGYLRTRLPRGTAGTRRRRSRGDLLGVWRPRAVRGISRGDVRSR